MPCSRTHAVTPVRRELAAPRSTVHRWNCRLRLRPSKTLISWHLHRLIKLFEGCFMGSRGSNVSTGGKLRLWSDCSDAQNDMTLLCTYMPTYKWASTRENLSSGVCEQHRRWPACATVQSDQRLCKSLFEKYHT